MKTNKSAVTFLYSACVLLISAVPVSSQSTYARTVERWGIQEIVFHSSRQYANPFKEVSISARFTCAGEQVDVGGFYDGDSAWKVRFMPEQVGRCRFETTSSDSEMNGQSGIFEVTAQAKSNHGPV